MNSLKINQTKRKCQLNPECDSLSVKFARISLLYARHQLAVTKILRPDTIQKKFVQVGTLIRWQSDGKLCAMVCTLSQFNLLSIVRPFSPLHKRKRQTLDINDSLHFTNFKRLSQLSVKKKKILSHRFHMHKNLTHTKIKRIQM